MTEVNLFETVKRHVCACALDLKLSSDIESFLKMPMQELHVSIPTRWMTGLFGYFRDIVSNTMMHAAPQKGVSVIIRS